MPDYTQNEVVDIMILGKYHQPDISGFCLDSSRSCLHWLNQNGALKSVLIVDIVSIISMNAGNGLNSCGHWYWIT